MKITICGSMKFAPEMQAARKQLEKLGYEAEYPNVAEGQVYSNNLDENAKLKRGFIDEHFRKIDGSDAVLIINHAKNDVDNYIGGNTLIEIAYAYAQGLEIFLLNPIPDVSYADEIRGMHPIILDGNAAKIDEYFASLPLLLVSSKSAVKQTALSRGLRRAGIRVRIQPLPTESGVNEQPYSVNETYEGAVNRHAALATAAKGKKAAYLATIESGLHKMHKDHGYFNCAVVILEKIGTDPKIGINSNVEFSRSMTDRVPSEYPDLGALVQAEYGSKLKDPLPYFTNNKLTRAALLENSVYNMAIQLEDIDGTNLA